MKHPFWLLCCVFSILQTPAWAQQRNVKATQGLSIKQVLLAEDVIDTGREQLVELLIRNRSAKNYALDVRLVITLPNRNMITFGHKHVTAKAFSDVRALIPYPIKKHQGGDYTLAARVFDRHGQLVLVTSKLQEKIFYGLDRSQRDAPPSKRRKKKLTAAQLASLEKEKKNTALKKANVVFEPPDLTFQKVTLTHSSMIRGETTHVQLFISNVGGNIATHVEYGLYWFFAQRPQRKVNFFRDQIRIIAPGEKKIIEIPLTIPSDEQPGKYVIVAQLDEDSMIKEINEKNNTKEAENKLIFGDVALVFPNNMYSFAEEGLFQFEWRSKKYNQFKLQISSDPSFPDPDSFYLPKGDLWTPSFKINPMRGEMPTMATGLMETKEVDHLYWRVVAKNSQGKITKSQSRKFYISLKAKN